MCRLLMLNNRMSHRPGNSLKQQVCRRCACPMCFGPACPFLLHCHQAAARAEAEKQRLADAAALREAEAAQLGREQEAAAAAKARHAAAVKDFFDAQVKL